MTENKDTVSIHKDAEGQHANAGTGARASGVASAMPTVITGSDDATIHRDPPGKKRPKKDRDVNFDVAERHQHT